MDVYISDIPHYIEFLVDYLGEGEVTDRLEQVHRAIQTESGAYLHYWLLPNSNFWLGLQEARRFNLRELTSDKMPRSIERPVEIAAKLYRLQNSMSQDVWDDFRSKILHADYLSPILFEIDTAAHFWQMGYDIEWFEPTGKSNSRIPEFAITSRNIRKVEVECKSKRADAGRKILRPAFYRFVDSVATPLSAEGYTGKVQIIVPDRMSTKDAWKKQVANAIIQLLQCTKEQLSLDDGTDITIDLHKLREIVIPAKKVITEAQAAKHPYSYLAVFAREYGKELTNPLVFELKSRNDDRFLQDVFDNLRDANRQFTGENAALICCFVPEVDSFAGLQQESALFRMTASFFKNHAKPYVFAVSYSSDPIRAQTYFDVTQSSPAIRLDNPFYDYVKFGSTIRVFNSNESTI